MYQYIYINIYIYIYIYIYPNVPTDAIVRLTHPRSGDRQETFLAPSANKETATMTESAQTTIFPNHHKALGLSRSKIKC